MEAPIIRMTTDVSVKTKLAGKQWNSIFKVVKEKKKKPVSQDVYVQWKYPSKMKVKEIYFQTQKCKENFSPSDYKNTKTSSSDLRGIKPDRSLNLQEEIEKK